MYLRVFQVTKKIIFLVKEPKVISLVVYIRTVVYPPQLLLLHRRSYPPFSPESLDQDQEPPTATVHRYLRVGILDLSLQGADLVTHL